MQAAAPSGIPRALSGPAGLVAVLLAVLVLALPGFVSLPPVDRDEVLFSQASRQMLETGDFVDIRFADQPRYKKPVGIYWMQAAAAAVTGAPDQIWSYRLISLLGVMGAAGFTWAIARRVTSGPGAVLAAVMLASCLVVGAEVRLAKTDAMQMAAILAGQWVLGRLWLPSGRAQVPQAGAFVWLFWLALAVAILVKGPVGPLVMGTTLAGLCLVRRDLALLRALRPLWGLALVLLLVAPWFIAITLKSDGAFWTASVGKDLIGKLAEGQENHGAPPGTYLAAVWVSFWPGSMLLAAALPGLWALRWHPFMPMALAWVVPTWVVFELTSTKLIHYTMPTYPALAILVVLAVEAGRLWRWAGWLLAWVPAVVMVALGVMAGQLGLTLPLIFWPLAVLAAALGLAVPLALRRGMGPIGLAGALVASGLGLSGAVYPVLARTGGLWPATDLAALAQQHPGCALTVAGYGEPSLVFRMDARVAMGPPDAALAALKAPGCQLVALPQDTAGLPAEAPLASVRGMDLGSGRILQLSVYLKP